MCEREIKKKGIVERDREKDGERERERESYV